MSSTRREIRALSALALPIIATNLGQMAMGVVDTLMVARVNKEALAAVTLGNVWITGTMMFAMGIIFGMDPIVTQAHGAQDRERGALALQRGVVVALGVGIALALSWLFTGEFLLAMNQDPAIAAEALKRSSNRLSARGRGTSPWLNTSVAPLRSDTYTRPAAPTGEA